MISGLALPLDILAAAPTGVTRPVASSQKTASTTSLDGRPR